MEKVFVGRRSFLTWTINLVVLCLTTAVQAKVQLSSYTITRAANQYGRDRILTSRAFSTEDEHETFCKQLNMKTTIDYIKYPSTSCPCTCPYGNNRTFISTDMKCVKSDEAREGCPLRIERDKSNNLIPLQLATSAPYTIRSSDGGWSNNVKNYTIEQDVQYLHNGNWRTQHTSNYFTVTVSRRSQNPLDFSWNDSQNYTEFNGRLLKLSFTCTKQDGNSASYCMVVKVGGSYSYSGIINSSSSVISHQTSHEITPETTAQIIPSSYSLQLSTIMTETSSSLQDVIIPTPTSSQVSSTVQPSGEGNKSARTDKDDSGVLVAVISAVAAIVCVAILSVSLCYMVRKKHGVPQESPAYTSTDTSNTIIQNNFPLPTLRNPTYQDIDYDTAVYAECSGDYEQVPYLAKQPQSSAMGGKDMPHTQKNTNAERESIYDNDKATKALDDDNIYQPLVQTHPQAPEYAPLTKPHVAAQHSDDYSPLVITNPKKIPGNKPATIPGIQPDPVYGVLEDPGHRTSDHPDYTELQEKRNEIDTPEYGVLENPGAHSEYCVLENPDLGHAEPEYGVLEQMPNSTSGQSEPEYGVLENPDLGHAEPEYGVLEQMPNSTSGQTEPDYGVLENPSACDDQYTSLDGNLYQELNTDGVYQHIHK